MEIKEKIMRERLGDAAKAFQYEHAEIKKKAKTLYLVALDAIQTIEKLKADLNAYKAPKFWKDTKPEDPKDRRFWTKADRIRHYLVNEPNSVAFGHFLRFNNLSLEQAKLMVAEADKAK